MDDWNDFGVPPADHESHHTYGEPESSSQGSFSSLFGSQGVDGGGESRSGEEPCSVMFRIPPRRSSNAAPTTRSRTESDVIEPEHPEALEEDGDFDDIGASSSGGVPTSESYRFHRKSYTKLEVISANQIQQLVHIFHVVVAIAACWTLFAVIISNTMFADVKPHLVSPALVSTKASAEASSSQNAPVRSAFGVFGQLPQPPSARFALPSEENYTYEQCFYFGEGMDLVFNELARVPLKNCSDHSHSCYVHWKEDCESKASQVVRQAVDLAADNPVGRLAPGDRRFVTIKVRTAVDENWYKFIVHVVIIACGTTLLLLGILFLIRVVRVGRKNLAQEQIFSSCLLFVTFLYLNVPLSILLAESALATNPSRDPFPKWYNDMETPLKVLRDVAFGPFMLFFVWCNIHTYRILDPAQKLGASFYVPKLAVIVTYAIIRISAFFSVGASFSEVPFMSAIVMQHAYGNFHKWAAFRSVLIYLVILSLFELTLLGIIIWEAVKTVRVLRRAPYMRHRSKQIGFRFFMYISLLYFISFFCFQVLLVVGRPKGDIIARTTLLFGRSVSFTIPPSHTIGTILLTFGYVVISAYVNLPHDSVGALKGWFKGSDIAPPSSRWSVSSNEDSCSASDNGSGSAGISDSIVTASQATDRRPREHQPRFIVDKDYELNQQIVEPITYRKRECDDSLELKANCFTMQTHVIMFNFAWYVYYYGTPKFESFKPKENPLPFRFTVAESISEPETDTHALVIDGLDRIVVTFKGTTSMRNLQTSLKIYHERLANVVPTDLDGVNEMGRLQIIFGRSFEAAKIHKGFAIAYASVAHRVMRRIKKLIEDKPRPVFLTGHSLGGALATICSLDVWIKLRISRRQIFVSTFGSPRVGNEAFRRIYNSVIALHWRIVVDPDMVAKIPKVGYRHVGKKVLLTPHGEMFIDPNALELKLWSGNTAGFAYHRKASYLLAMKAWCLRHHKMSYTPVFWPFPIRDEDYQRFEGAEVQEENEEVHGKKLADKIIRMDAMVDSLDDGTYANMEAVEKWARLTRRLLLNDKLKSGGMNP